MVTDVCLTTHCHEIASTAIVVRRDLRYVNVLCVCAGVDVVSETASQCMDRWQR